MPTLKEGYCSHCHQTITVYLDNGQYHCSKCDAKASSK